MNIVSEDTLSWARDIQKILEWAARTEEPNRLHPTHRTAEIRQLCSHLKGNSGLNHPSKT